MYRNPGLTRTALREDLHVSSLNVSPSHHPYKTKTFPVRELRISSRSAVTHATVPTLFRIRPRERERTAALIATKKERERERERGGKTEREEAGERGTGA